MKRISFLFALVAAIIITACSTDFSVNGDYEERAIVHAVIDANDTIHFVKINKTFLGDGNALEFAQVPDSTYFTSVEGTVSEYLNGNLVREFELRDTIITNKEDGIFYAPEQKIYYFKTPANNKLNPDARIDLNLNLNNGKHIVKGSTELVKGVQVTDPKSIGRLSFVDAIVQDESSYKNETFKYSTGTNAVIFDYRVYFTYNEEKATGTTQHTIEWKIGEHDRESSSLGLFNVNGISFYEFLQNSIPEDDEVIKRTLHSMTFQVIGGSEDLSNYILVNQPTSQLAQSQPTFSNVEGGLGIFTSCMKDVLVRQAAGPQLNNRILHTNSTRQLCEGPFTSALKFCSDIAEDQSYSFYCN